MHPRVRDSTEDHIDDHSEGEHSDRLGENFSRFGIIEILTEKREPYDAHVTPMKNGSSHTETKLGSIILFF